MAILGIYTYSDPTSNQEVFVSRLSPHIYSDASDIQTVDVSGVSLAVELTNLSSSPTNVRQISATIRIFDSSDNTTSTDPSDQYWYSFVPEGDADNWISSGVVDIQPVVFAPTVSPGTMALNCVLKIKAERNGIELGIVSYPFIVDEVPPVTTSDTNSGSYPLPSLTLLLSVTDFTSTVTYFTTNGDNPTTSDNVYTPSGIVVSAADATTTVKYFSIDAAGNIESPDWALNENTVFIAIDGTAPSVTIDSISKTDLNASDIAEIVWYVNEDCSSAVIERGGTGAPGSGIFYASVGGIAADDNQTFSISPVGASLPNGISTFYIYATDLAGNIGFTSFQINFDNQIPVVEVYEVYRSTLAPVDSATVVWRTSVDGDFMIRLGGANPDEGDLLSSGAVLANEVMETLLTSTSLLPNVLNTIKLYVTASGGNIGLNSFNMTVDTLPPSTIASINGTDGPFTSSFNLRIDAVDSVVGTVATDLSNVVPQASSVSRIPNLFSNFDGFSTKEVALADYIYSDPTPTQTLDIIVPVEMSIPTITNLATDSVTINWTTAIPSDSILEYDTDNTLASFSTITDSTMNVEHNITIPGLTPGATYYFRAKSGTEASAILSFTTNLVVDIIPPTINNITTSVISDTEIELSWTTDEPANSTVIVATDDLFTTENELPIINNSPKVSAHTYLVSGLIPGTDYWFKVKSIDASGNESTSVEVVTATTLLPGNPVASNITTTVYRTVAIVRWNTDVPTSSQVQYGTSSSYNLIANSLIAGYKTEHEVILSNLTPNRTYHFTVTGVDAVDRPVTSFDQTFLTQKNRDIRPIIYLSTDGSIPTTSAYEYRAVESFFYLIDKDTVLKYFAVDAYGNAQPLQTQFYTFDNAAPIITVDWMEPILVKEEDISIVRFKVNEPASFRIVNQYGTLLASQYDIETIYYTLYARDEAGHYSDPLSAMVGGQFLEPDVWVEIPIPASLLEEGDNHITIYAQDEHGNEGQLLVGHITKDTIAPIVEPTVPAGFYNSVFYVNLVATNLRDSETVAIYYTTDGSLPTLDSNIAYGQVYNILISTTTTLRWFGVDGAGNMEAPKFATYIIDRQAPSIYATPIPGNYDEVIEVELKSNKPGKIFYTLNETIPVEPVNQYTQIYKQPIQILHDTVITCYAKDLAGNVSEIATFAYEIAVLHDKKFKKVIGFQDKIFLETEFNEAQDNINRRIEELAKEVVGKTGIVHGFDIIPSDFPNSFEFYLQEGKSYIDGKFVAITRNAQSFVPSPLETEGTRTYHIIISPAEPIFRPTRPGHPGWEEGVPDITTYRLEEGYQIRAVEELPDEVFDPFIELYEVIRPALAESIADCTIIDKRRIFEPLSAFQKNMQEQMSDMQSNILALGLEVESYKLRNLLGLKNAFVDTFESTKDIDLSKSTGYRYTKTRFEL